MSQINEFMIQQADMAGFAGIIGAASIFAVTPLIFKGEAAGFSAAAGAIAGAYRGNVMASAQKELNDYDAQMEIDKREANATAKTVDGLTEAQASAWLSQEGFSKPNSMSAVESYNNMMKNYGQIGAADAASIMHSGNMKGFNAQTYMAGSGIQAMQKAATTAGLGKSGATLDSTGTISMEDGEVMGAKIEATNRIRHNDGNGNSREYNTNDIGTGQAVQQYAKDMGAAITGQLDSNATASVANATSAAAGQIAAGQGLLATGAFNDGMFNSTSKLGSEFMEGSRAQSREKFEGVAGYGSTVDMEKSAYKAYEDSARAGETTNKTADMMQSEETDAKGRKFYDREEASHGEALQAMGALQGSMQTGKAADRAKTTEINGDMDYVMGAGAQARKAANDNLGIGEKFGAQTDGEQIAQMAKVKENAKTAFFGGIEAQNADIQKRNGSSGAIEDMITDAQEKAITGSTHADNMRGAYGKNLNGSFKGMTLGDTLDEIDQTKIDQQAGQALGIKANKGVGVDYTDNAMYGEMSQQQSTKAKLDAQGGVGGAVGIDVMEASIKAGTQMGSVLQQSKILEDAIASGAAKGAQTLAQAAAKVAEVQTGSQMGGTAGLMKKFSDPKAIQETLNQQGYTKEAKELDGMGAGDVAAWVASKQAGHLTGMHGLALRNDDGVMTSVGMSIGDDGARAMTVDSSYKKDSSSAETSGSIKTFNNDVHRGVNTDTETRELMAANGGSLEQATEAKLSSEALKFHANPLNDFGEVAAFIQQSTGMDPETAAYVAGAVGLGGVAALATNKYTKENVKMKPEQLAKLTPISDIDGNVKGYENASGKKVADGSGYILDKKGKKLESGVIGRAMRNAKNSAVDLFSRESSSQPNNSTVDKSTANQQDDPTKKPDDVQHDKTSSGSNSKDIIAKNVENKNLSIPGTVKPAPNVVGEMKIPNPEPLSAPGSVHKPSGTVLDNKGFFEKKRSALKSIWDGSGSMKSKIAMSAGAMALGSVSATASNLIDTFDPIAHANGTSLGNSSFGGDELKQMQAKMKSSGAAVGIPAWAKDIQTASPIPQHAQTAFSTPTGFNSMGGMNAYNNNTSNTNTTAQEYKANYAQASVDKMDDINISSEYSEEHMSVNSELLEKIVEQTQRNE